MPTHTIRILSCDERRNLLKERDSRLPLVVPAYVFVKSNDNIEFVAKGSDATVTFPEDSPLLDNVQIKLTAGRNQSVPLRGNLVAGQIYAYSVFVKKDSDFAVANSSPKIIIE